MTPWLTGSRVMSLKRVTRAFIAATRRTLASYDEARTRTNNDRIIPITISP